MESELKICGMIVTDNNEVILSANPSIYDTIYKLILNFDERTFELVDGAGQMITGDIFGTFELVDNVLTMYYERDYDVYSNENISLSDTKRLIVTIVNEEKSHFDGYCMEVSTQTVTFSESPFILDQVSSRRSTTLFNMLNDNPYPLVFYNGFKSVPCDVQYERFARDERYLKEYYCDKITKDEQVLIPFSEETRRFLMGQNIPFGWFVIHFNKEKQDLIIINHTHDMCVSCFSNKMVAQQIEGTCDFETAFNQLDEVFVFIRNILK